MEQLFYVCLLVLLINIDFRNEIAAHVGEPCRGFVLVHFCWSSNSYCDKDNICRCKKDYPVLTDPHKCQKPKRNGERCESSLECKYLDKNSYCTQLPYQSKCQCNTGYTYSPQNGLCSPTGKNATIATNLTLPTAIGVSLALTCLLCCCLALLHFCRRRIHPSTVINDQWRMVTPRQPENNTLASCQTNLLSNPDPLPPYEVAISLQPVSHQENNLDEPPPCYDEVMKSTVLNDKGKMCQ